MYDRCLGPDTYVTIDVNNCCQGPVTQVPVRCLGPDRCVKMNVYNCCLGPVTHSYPLPGAG